jgi:hypothetical protein
LLLWLAAVLAALLRTVQLVVLHAIQRQQLFELRRLAHHGRLQPASGWSHHAAIGALDPPLRHLKK